jgi:hypothetical protein
MNFQNMPDCSVSRALGASILSTAAQDIRKNHMSKVNGAEIENIATLGITGATIVGLYFASAAIGIGVMAALVGDYGYATILLTLAWGLCNVIEMQRMGVQPSPAP